MMRRHRHLLAYWAAEYMTWLPVKMTVKILKGVLA